MYVWTLEQGVIIDDMHSIKWDMKLVEQNSPDQQKFNQLPKRLEDVGTYETGTTPIHLEQVDPVTASGPNKIILVLLSSE
jgi:hypothetical protein